MPSLSMNALAPPLAVLGILVLGGCASSRPEVIANARQDANGPLAVEIREEIELQDGRQEIISVVAPISAADGSFSAHLQTKEVSVEMSGKAQSGIPPTFYGGIYAYKRAWLIRPAEATGAPTEKDTDEVHGGLHCSVGEAQTIGGHAGSGSGGPNQIRTSRILLRIGRSFPLP